MSLSCQKHEAKVERGEEIYWYSVLVCSWLPFWFSICEHTKCKCTVFMFSGSIRPAARSGTIRKSSKWKSTRHRKFARWELRKSANRKHRYKPTVQGRNLMSCSHGQKLCQRAELASDWLDQSQQVDPTLDHDYNSRVSVPV